MPFDVRVHNDFYFRRLATKCRVDTRAFFRTAYRNVSRSLPASLPTGNRHYIIGNRLYQRYGIRLAWRAPHRPYVFSGAYLVGQYGRTRRYGPQHELDDVDWNSFFN